MNKKIKRLILLFSVSVIIFAVYYYYSNDHNKKEEFKILTYEQQPILDSCKNMTPKELLSLFNNNVDLFTKTMVAYDISAEILTDKDNYPKIASYLVSNNIIKC